MLKRIEKLAHNKFHIIYVLEVTAAAGTRRALKLILLSRTLGSCGYVLQILNATVFMLSKEWGNTSPSQFYFTRLSHRSLYTYGILCFSIRILRSNNPTHPTFHLSIPIHSEAGVAVATGINSDRNFRGKQECLKRRQER